jgi:maleylacetate reductase
MVLANRPIRAEVGRFIERTFTFESLPYRMIFGSGTVAMVRTEAERLGIKRAMVLTTPAQANLGAKAQDWLGDRFAACFTEARMHTPVLTTERAVAYASAQEVDGLVAIGGGSTIGLSKAISIRMGLPQIAVPTTYAGSEMTPILGETKDGEKTTQRNAKLLPDAVVYDVDLTLELPAAMSATSGMNAMAHAIEALYAPNANPIVSMMAESGIAALAKALPIIVEEPRDQKSRTLALYGAWLCGACLGSVGMSLHHKLCHVLGGTFDLPHAETHAIVLPHAVAYNMVASEAVAAVARALDVNEASMGLFNLGRRLGVPASLGSLGMSEGGIDQAADLAVMTPYPNPRPLDREAIRELIARAYRGDPPFCAQGQDR